VSKRSHRGNSYRGDRFTKAARDQGYAARSVFKLKELDQRFKLFKRGDRVVDLGCYPGSWSRYAWERLGSKGVLVGVDLEETQGIPAHFITRSVMEVTAEELLEWLGGPCDVLISDMAPRTTGDRFGDHVRQIELADRALELATQVVRPGGSFVVKLFEGPEINDFHARVKQRFGRLKRTRPEASQRSQLELFLVAQGRLEVR
jgi:23S rRNA (uridine2552-2'-O)-methyltransferase